MATRKSSPDGPSTSTVSPTDRPVAIAKASRRDERYAKSDFVVQWDPQEGLMPQILAITASPRKETKKKRNNILLIGSNRECSSCGDGGDMVCCSRCNLCYHTLCHNPPLDDDNLPQCKWNCFNCSIPLDPNKSDESDEQPEDSDSSRMSHAFRMLMKAVEHDNSEEFQLTKEVSLPYVFAGYGRPTQKRLKTMKSTRLDQGLVPLPIKTCFSCEKSARKGPLLPCDFCPLLFHADCLDPPLSMIPTSRWMCPNHPNHLIDDKVSSERHTVRVKLWDEFCCNSISEQQTIYEFFHKNSRKDPPFRRKRCIEPEFNRVSIPSHVKAMYRAARRRREQHDWLNGVISMNPRVMDLDSVTVDDLSDTTVRMLAARMLQQMRSEQRQIKIEESPRVPETPEILTVQPLAYLTPGLGCSGPQILLTEDCSSLGRRNVADIDLDYYSECKYVSQQHAIIFYDRVTDCFELLNYSEHGTHVDGVLHSNNVEHFVQNRPINSVPSNPALQRAGPKEKKTKEKRPPMKRGRKSKAEKAAIAAAEAAACEDDLDLRPWPENGKGGDPYIKQENASCDNMDSEDTLSVAGRSSTPAIPLSEESEVPEMTGMANGHHEENDSGINDEDDIVGNINGSPQSCICDQNNLIGRTLPNEGFEGSAILHSGSVIKLGCIVLLFNRVVSS